MPVASVGIRSNEKRRSPLLLSRCPLDVREGNDLDPLGPPLFYLISLLLVYRAVVWPSVLCVHTFLKGVRWPLNTSNIHPLGLNALLLLLLPLISLLLFSVFQTDLFGQ